MILPSSDDSRHLLVVDDSWDDDGELRIAVSIPGCATQAAFLQRLQVEVLRDHLGRVLSDDKPDDNFPALLTPREEIERIARKAGLEVTITEPDPKPGDLVMATDAGGEYLAVKSAGFAVTYLDGPERDGRHRVPERIRPLTPAEQQQTLPRACA